MKIYSSKYSVWKLYNSRYSMRKLIITNHYDYFRSSLVTNTQSLKISVDTLLKTLYIPTIKTFKIKLDIHYKDTVPNIKNCTDLIWMTTT